MKRHDRFDRRERDRIRDRDQRPPQKSGWGYGLRVLVLLGVGLAAVLMISRSGFKSDRVVTSPGPVKLAKLSARDLQETSALNGIDGVNMAEAEEVDLILLDINLPDIDGYEVVRRIRSSDKKHTLTYVPVIAITANALKGDAEKALAAGCDVYMSKPINIRELWARVEAFVPSPQIKEK